ncbi:MAG TPA: DUF1015 domain-containing protein [Bacteroidota bacterium]|nr:DUF1015 domain-containing protein [Bacteroidota bacterium]
MLLIKPFRGIRYNQSNVNINTVVAPPYDVISPEQQDQLYNKDPHNIVRLILGREADRYSSSAQTFAEWQKSGVLQRDAQPAIYALVQTFKHTTGETIQRKGFIALCHLEEFDKGIVLPHEKTLSKAKEDRLKLFKATNSNFSQIFSLYSDPDKRVDAHVAPVHKKSPAVDVSFEGVRNQLWTITDRQAVESIAREMEPKQVLIADGHHRYETALAYRDFMKAQNPAHNGTELYNYVMMFFTNLDDEGLVIFPTHRVIHSLPRFDWSAFKASVEKYFVLKDFPSENAMMQALGAQKKFGYGIIVKAMPQYWVASLKNDAEIASLVPTSLPPDVRNLDVVLLHSYFLGTVLGISAEAQEKKLNIHYIQNVGECGSEVSSGAAQVAFLVNATKIGQVRAVAKAGHTMPQKSTFFYPKLLSGLVLNKMAD